MPDFGFAKTGGCSPKVTIITCIKPSKSDELYLKMKIYLKVLILITIPTYRHPIM